MVGAAGMFFALINLHPLEKQDTKEKINSSQDVDFGTAIKKASQKE